MRDPDRIDPILDRVRKCWKADPDLRLGQLVFIGCPLGDVFYVEDDILLDNMEKVCSKNTVL